MSNTTTRTPRRGRPEKVKEAIDIQDTVASVPSPTPTRSKIKREERVKEVKEYRLTKRSGATFLMQQKNVMSIDADNRLREIRYCPNEPSIYRDEQNDSSVRQAIIFTEGRLFVRPDQPNLAAYLEAHPDNKANGGNRFFLVDERKDSEEKLNKQFLEHDAIGLIRTKELDEILSVALGIGINVDRPVAEIKHDLMVYAKKNPRKFIESFDNPVIEMKSKITQARKYQIIKFKENGVFWTDTGKLIISVPDGKDPLDVFVRYCMTEAAAPLVAEIERQIS